MKHKVDCFSPFDPTRPHGNGRGSGPVTFLNGYLWLLSNLKRLGERNRMGQDLKRYLTRSVHTVPGDIFADRFLLNLTGDVGR